MGYISDFKIEICDNKNHNDQINIEKIIYDLFNLSGYNFESEDDLTITLSNSKWYDHLKDMRDLSEKYPNLLFGMIRYGEEQGDIEYFYFRNGKSYSEQLNIKLPQFFPLKLK